MFYYVINMKIKEIYSLISDNIIYYRTNNPKYGYLTYEKLARLSGINVNLIKNIESKNKNTVINLNNLNRLANALDIPLYKLFIKRKVK